MFNWKLLPLSLSPLQLRGDDNVTAVHSYGWRQVARQAAHIQVPLALMRLVRWWRGYGGEHDAGVAASGGQAA